MAADDLSEMIATAERIVRGQEGRHLPEPQRQELERRAREFLKINQMVERRDAMAREQAQLGGDREVRRMVEGGPAAEAAGDIGRMPNKDLVELIKAVPDMVDGIKRASLIGHILLLPVAGIISGIGMVLGQSVIGYTIAAAITALSLFGLRRGAAQQRRSIEQMGWDAKRELKKRRALRDAVGKG